MKKLIILLALITPCFGYCQETGLAGSWTIDLRPSPEAEGYFQEFVVTEIADANFQGSFYGSPLENSLLNRQWGDKLYFAFTTRDQTYAYYHSGYLLDGKLHGISYCPGREFTAPWTGVKK